MNELSGSTFSETLHLVGAQVVGQMLSRSFAEDRSVTVLRVAVRLLRTLLHSTVALAVGSELSRMTQRLLPSFLSRVADELFNDFEVFLPTPFFT